MRVGKTWKTLEHLCLFIMCVCVCVCVCACVCVWGLGEGWRTHFFLVLKNLTIAHASLSRQTTTVPTRWKDRRCRYYGAFDVSAINLHMAYLSHLFLAFCSHHLGRREVSALGLAGLRCFTFGLGVRNISRYNI